MTDSDLRELDGWIAEKFMGWKRIENGKLWLTPDSEDGKGVTFRNPLKFSSDVVSFALVKREIERRGWGWQANFVKQYGERGFGFTIFDAVRIIGFATGEVSEELAGCLAVKAAVEGSDAHSD